MIHVFVGPTLAADDARALLPGVVVHGPASQGDLYRVARRRPQAIGLIDGYFDRAPAVWHKEILWALKEGVHVLGSSSMGALRAAELEPFGMVGVGAIYAAFRSGALEDDDEVAVVHGPAEDGYRPLSEAMVNLRATLAAAVQAGVLREATRAALEAAAKAMFYVERSYPALLRRGATLGLDEAELRALGAWLPTGQANQKREDARALLAALAEHHAAPPGPKTVRFRFAHTDAWETVRLRAEAVDAEVRQDTGAAVQEELGISGQYAALAERARQKRTLLDEQGLLQPAPADANLTDAALWHWFFGEHLRIPLPPSLATYAAQAGFGDAAALRRAAVREYLYQRRRHPNVRERS